MYTERKKKSIPFQCHLERSPPQKADVGLKDFLPEWGSYTVNDELLK